VKHSNIYAGYRYPAQIISHAVWLYHRFTTHQFDQNLLMGDPFLSVDNQQGFLDKMH